MSRENPTPEELARAKARRILIAKRVAFFMALAVVLSYVAKLEVFSKWLG